MSMSGRSSRSKGDGETTPRPRSLRDEKGGREKMRDEDREVEKSRTKPRKVATDEVVEAEVVE